MHIIKLQKLLIIIALTVCVVSGVYFKPFNVSYDHRALIIDGQRRMLVSAGIHYPRATPEMWPDLIAKSKEGGADVVETYVFWSGHEPVRGQYNFEDRYDLVKFVKLVGESKLYLHLRIGPYICAEWNFGGFPVWLRDIPGIVFRTDNEPFKEEMKRFVKKIVDVMRDESLFSWQGGPIIMLQIENEYGNYEIEGSFGQKGKDYMKWAADMAVGLGAGVPWVMCKQTDAPEYIIDACNGFYCDGFQPNSNKKPVLWTENWDGWYTSWGGRLPHRPVEDLAFAVARFYQRGGSFQNYYMFFGGTNFGRTSGGPNYITSYDYDAPIDEYGLLSQPKWGHLKDLHAAIKLCEPALVAADSAEYIKLGSSQEMWPDLIAKSKEGGADVVETYVFWSGHEPVRGQYNFEDRYDLVKFVKLVGESKLYLHLRIGPYICAEWNFGGFPVWLRDIPGIVFRTDNEPFKEEMQRFVKKIVDVMRDKSLFSWQGGPIIMLQIENEYGNFAIEGSFGQKGKDYMKWAADMAVGLGAGVPWVMCRQTDAPEYIIDACNGFYCDGFQPNSNKKPVLWTENWDGWYTSWGGRLPHRPVEDLAFAVARFYQRGGSFQNYYMFFGGTNFGRTSGGPNYITSYDYDAPIDEYGLLSQPKWGHLKDLHAAIKLCEPALVAADSAEYIKLGSSQEAHVYRGGNTSICSAFLANIDEHESSTVQFLGRSYTLPPWSVSILPDCKNTVLNTAKVGAQTSIKVADLKSTSSTKTSAPELLMVQKEPIGVWGDNFTVQGIWEHLNVTKDRSDYLWYITRVIVSDEDIAHWKENAVSPSLRIDFMRDVVCIFINGQLIGSAKGDWVEVVQQVQLKQGYNDLMLLSQTMGLQNYGAYLEKDGAGFKGQITLTNFKNGDVNLTPSQWTYQVGLKGEFMKFFATGDNESSKWTNLTQQEVPSILSWYKTHFDSPGEKDPVVIDMSSMGKGQAWVNGHHIGRYWTLVAPNDGCQENCDYRGVYDLNKCNTNCGKPTQTRYHVPRSWLQPKDNLLVLFEETGGNPFKISIKTVSIETVCAHVYEDYYPPVQTWSQSNGELITSQKNPVMQLQCEDGYTIASIDFASYGTPQGSCQTYSTGKCHASTSASILSKACEGHNSCKIEVSNSVFGDPCRKTVKALAVKARCKPSPTSTS